MMAKSSLGQDSDSTAAVAVLKRAVELDAESRYQQALVCYQEGIDMLLQVLKGERVSVSALSGTERKLKKTKLTNYQEAFKFRSYILIICRTTEVVAFAIDRCYR